MRQSLNFPALRPRAARSQASATGGPEWHRARAIEFAELQRAAQTEGNAREALRWEIEPEKAKLLGARSVGNSAEAEASLRRLVALGDSLSAGDALRWQVGSALMAAERFAEALTVQRVFVEARQSESARSRRTVVMDWMRLLQYAACLWKATGETAAAVGALREAAHWRRRSAAGQPEITDQLDWRRYGMDTVPEFVAALA